MTNTKRYYWLKLKDSFFTDLTTKALLQTPDGEKMVLIYIKIMLANLNNKGFIHHQQFLPSIEEEIALAIDERVDTVTSAITTLKRLNMVQFHDEDKLFIPALPSLVGSETTSASHTRKHRQQKKALQSNTSVTDVSHNEISCNTEKIKKRKEKDLKLDIEKEEEEIKESLPPLPLSTDPNKISSDYDRIIESWNNTSFTQIIKIAPGSSRALKLSNLILEHGENNILAAINKAAKSTFLNGANERNWTMNFDWFIRPSNFLKIVEENYDPSPQCIVVRKMVLPLPILTTGIWMILEEGLAQPCGILLIPKRLPVYRRQLNYMIFKELA